LRVLYGGVAGFLIGVAAFFTFVVPEVAFSVLGGSQLGPFLAAIFPRFYAITAAGAAILTVLAFLLPARKSMEVVWPATSLVLTLVAWLWLLPAVNRAIGTAAFGALHGLSLGLDLVAIVLWVLALVSAFVRADRG
jgi:hypothetical protein